MLIFSENFGSLSPETVGMRRYFNASSPWGFTSTCVDFYSGGLPGYVVWNCYSTIDFDYLSWPQAGFNAPGNLAYVALGQGVGRMSKNAILLRSPGLWLSSPFFNPTKRMVVGAWYAPVAPAASGFGASVADFPHLGGAATFSFIFSAMAQPTDLYNSYSTGYYNYASSTKYPHHMRVEFTLTGDAAWTVKLYNYSNTGATYPAIAQSSVVYIGGLRPVMLEVFIDANDVINKQGIVKCAVNGITIAEWHDIYTMDYLNFNSNPLSPDAYYRQFHMAHTSVPNDNYNNSEWQCDGFYVCDGSAGYQDDFLGPVVIATAMPVEDGDQNAWNPIEASAEGVTGHCSCVDAEYIARRLFVEDTYLQGDMHGQRELFRFDFPFDTLRTQPKAVHLRALFEKNYVFGDDCSPIIQGAFRASGQDILETPDYTFFPLDEVHRVLSMPMSVVPGLATPWTWEYLQYAQFGFTYLETSSFDATANCSIFDVKNCFSKTGVASDGSPAKDGTWGNYVYFGNVNGFGYITFLVDGLLKHVELYGNGPGYGNVDVSVTGTDWFRLPRTDIGVVGTYVDNGGTTGDVSQCNYYVNNLMPIKYVRVYYDAWTARHLCECKIITAKKA